MKVEKKIFKKLLNSNKQYQEGDIVACNNFSLYKVDENGEVTLAIDHVLSHYIYVSGFTEDSKVIVSSWGNKYIFNDENSSWVYKLTLKYNNIEIQLKIISQKYYKYTL